MPDPFNNEIHTMVDIETLGTQSDSMVLSIGAITFDYNIIYEDKSWEISLDDSTPGSMSVETVKWWMKQSEPAKQTVFGPRLGVPLESALDELAEFYNDFGESGPVWANGATFDIQILEHHYRHVMSRQAPWKYYNVRCMRSLREIAEYLGISRTKPKVAHDALSDAEAQARTVQAVWKAIIKDREKAKEV